MVAACSGDDGESAAGEDGGRASRSGEPLATLEVIDQQIDVKTTEDEEFGPGTTGMGLDVGDQIRSNATGFGELGYFEGSWMRIEARATLTIEELTDTEESQVVSTSVDGGRLWSRTEKLTGSGDRFDVETPVGTASVRGTRFAIDCTVDWADYAGGDAGTAPTTTEPSDGDVDGAEPAEDESLEVCDFVVIEGRVAVVLPDGTEYVLEASQRLVVAGDGREPIGPLQILPDELYADPWIAKNLGVDLEKPDAEDLLAGESEANAAAATLAQAWEVDVDVVSSTDPRYPAGAEDTGFWRVTVDCSSGVCTSGRQVTDGAGQPALRDSAGNPVVDQIVPLGPGRYEFSSTWNEPCEREGTVLAPAGLSATRSGVYDVTATEFIDGRWVATELRGTVDTTMSLTDAGRAAGCALPDNAPSVGFTTQVVARAT